VFNRIRELEPEAVEKFELRLQKWQTRPLDSFEQVVLTSLMMLGGEAAAMTVLDEAEKLSERHCNLGTLYGTVENLATRGLITCRDREGKSAKRLYAITQRGLEVLGEQLAAEQAARQRRD